MAKLSLVKGTASLSVNIFVPDSSVTTGAGKTGLAFNTASLTAYYVQPRGTPTAITLATLASATAAYSSGGFIEVDSTNLPGVYRLDIPNAALTGANSVVVMLKGAANMAPVPLEIELTAVDNQDATRYGLSALPNAAAGANGGLPTGNASGQVTVGTVAADAITAAAVATSAVTELQAGLMLAASYTAPDNTSIAAIKAKTDNLPASPAATSDIPSAAANAAALLDSADGIETGLTPRGALRLIAAALAGKVSGAGGSTVTIRNVGDTKNRIQATVDSDGNRSAVTTDAS